MGPRNQSLDSVDVEIRSQSMPNAPPGPAKPSETPEMGARNGK